MKPISKESLEGISSNLLSPGELIRFLEFKDEVAVTLQNYGGPESSTHCNLRKHMQVDKTQAKQENIFINLTTQHNTLHTTQHITEIESVSRGYLTRSRLDISGTLSGNPFTFGANVHLDSKMN